MPTQTFIGQNGTSASVSSQTLSAYNQTGGNNIVVFSVANNSLGHTSSISDTAANTYLPVFAGNGIIGGNNIIQAWYAANCTGNASNVVQVNFSASCTYSGLMAYDLGGANFIDQSSSGTGTIPANTNQNLSVSAFTTTAAAEVILVASCVGPPGPFTLVSFDGNYTRDCHSQTIGALGLPTVDIWASEHYVTSATQTGITPGFQGQNGAGSGAPMAVIAVTFKGSGTTASKGTQVIVMN